MRTRQAQVFRMGQVVGILQMSAGEVEDHLTDCARDNPLLVVRARPPMRLGNSTTEALELTAADSASSLYDHAMRQLAGLLAGGGPVARLVMALIEDLEPSGWLSRPVALIAAELGLSVEVVDKGLALVQRRIEPAGLFARNLEECLRLQVQDRGLYDAAMALVLRHLAVMERGGRAALVAATGLEPGEVARCLATLRRLDPKPGAAFVRDPTLMREPDVRVTPGAEGWQVEFAFEREAQIGILPMGPGAATPALREAQAQARALRQALALRQSAIRRVMAVLVARQGGYFRGGAEALVPMTMAEIAAETGFHASTVSRVLAGLLIEGPGGIVAARDLCVGAACADGASKPRVMARLRAWIAAEDPGNPLSDQDLAERLAAEGMAVSRRVVAKYRQEIGKAPAAQRRQSA
ncbi:RNA polymerase subunit sigma-54 [Pararhodobacter aggregans]|uniref:RNA polymerase sigma-54 factor n=1 Tax=Pararhodobacter aggregans TaxID=404875 RepID=A0A2T7UXS4_9RHOB|nr:RNA polymerase subunit sigma-54 [Pararhodobacter aggregans]